jgi:origin recognition complex subunit 3
MEKVPCAFIITGPNIASQDLLFEQLQESLTGPSATASKFARLRSSDATNLKATLRKIIKDVTAPPDDDDEQFAVTLSVGYSHAESTTETYVWLC